VSDLVQPESAAPLTEVEVERLRVRAERERKARSEAEAIAERSTRELYDRQRELQLMEAVSAAANEADDMRTAMQVAVDRICAHTGWPVGHVYLVAGPEEPVALVPTEIWHLDDPVRFAAFREVTEATFLQSGDGLPGRIHASGEPAWVVDVTKDANFPRVDAAVDIGVRAAFGSPVLIADEVVAVLEFFTPAVTEPDARLLEVISQVGAQLGRAVERELADLELQQRSAQLELYAGELEHANDELKEFAYVASHDLSEPLRTISGFVQLLAKRYRGRLDADADEFIGFVVEGTERMQRLIDDLLAYSRIGRAELRIEDVSASEALEHAREALAASVYEVGASVTVGELPTVRADAGQLERLFLNLLSNAIKFQGSAPPRVQVGARRDGSAWHFTVADNGIGIEPRHAERIFNVFARLHSPGEYPGTGIGLSICKKIVERHGGKIWVKPRPDGGSTFHFTLPDPGLPVADSREEIAA
jgi:signal transduction histidine kinase